MPGHRSGMSTARCPGTPPCSDFTTSQERLLTGHARRLSSHNNPLIVLGDPQPSRFLPAPADRPYTPPLTNQAHTRRTPIERADTLPGNRAYEQPHAAMGRRTFRRDLWNNSSGTPPQHPTQPGGRPAGDETRRRREGRCGRRQNEVPHLRRPGAGRGARGQRAPSRRSCDAGDHRPGATAARR